MKIKGEDLNMEKIRNKQLDIILQLIFNFKQIKGKTRLMKYLFLLEKEVSIDVYFNFHPKHYGPYSKEIEEDLKFLEENGFIHSFYDRDEKTIIYAITDKGFIKIKDSLNNKTQDKIKNIISNLEGLSLKELINIVYSKYPEYTLLSRY